MTGTTMPTPLYPLYQQSMGFSPLIITIIFASYSLGVLLTLVVMGNWSDQLGRRPLLALGLGFAITSNTAFFLANDLTALLAGRFLSGMSAGIFTATATVAVVELAPSTKRSLAVFAATAANMGGLGFGPIYAGILAQTLPAPLQLSYATHTLMMIAGLWIVYRLPETVRRPKQVRLTLRKPGVPVDARPIFIPAAVAAFAGFAVTGLFTSVAPSLLGELMGQTHGVIIGVVAGSIFFASIGGQHLQERLPQQLSLPLGCLVMMTGALLLAGAIYIASAWWLFASSLLSGLGHGLVFRAGMSGILAASPPDRRAQVAASFFLVAYIALSLPVVGLGLMIGSLSLAKAGMVFAAIVALLSLVALIIVWLRNR